MGGSVGGTPVGGPGGGAAGGGPGAAYPGVGGRCVPGEAAAAAGPAGAATTLSCAKSALFTIWRLCVASVALGLASEICRRITSIAKLSQCQPFAHLLHRCHH